MMRNLAIGLIAMTVGSLLVCSSLTHAAEKTREVKPLTVGSLTLGAGQPRIIVSTSGSGVADTLEQARQIAGADAADLLEFRIDTLDFATDAARVTALGRQLVEILHGKPLLLTFRTQPEGGQRRIGDAEYAALYSALIDAGFANLIDIEMYRGTANVKALIHQAHARGIPVVLSSHDLHGTPTTPMMVERLREQEALGADVLKLAVTPHDGNDVARLLSATAKVRQRSERPLLTMAMGGLGTISRLAGEAFGSNLTFGALGQASAPGQLDAQALHAALSSLHQAR